MLHWSGGGESSGRDERPFAVMNERAGAVLCHHSDSICRKRQLSMEVGGGKRGEGREVGKLLHASFRLSLDFISDF